MTFILDPSEIGSAPMKYALHFIGHRIAASSTGGADRIDWMVWISNLFS